MKRNILLFGIIIFAVIDAFGSPLLFKATKEINSKGLVELGSFDASKYRQIRIGVKTTDRVQTSSTTKNVAEIQLNFAKRELQRSEELLEKGVISSADYNRVKEQVEIAQRNYDNADEIAYPALIILGLESLDEILVTSFDEKGNFTRSVVIDSPPSKISVKVSGKGKYMLYVWGQ